MSDLERRLARIAGEDEWKRHEALAELQREGMTSEELGRLRRMLDEDDATRRAAARMALSALAAPGAGTREAARKELESALRSEEADTRVLAATSIGEAGDPTAGPPLVRLLSDPEPNVVAAAADALGELGYTPALEPLVQLSQARELWLRAAAIVALGRLEDERAVPALAELADDPGLQRPIIEALDRIGHPSVLEPLGRIYASGAEEAIRAAGRVLSAHPDLDAPGWVREGARGIEGKLRHELVEEDSPAVARLLAYAGTLEAVQTLVDLVGPPRYSEAAIAGLLAVPADVRAELILERLDEAEDQEAATLLSLLPHLSRPSHIRPLVPLLSGPAAQVRAAAAAALARAPAAETLPLLAAELDRAGVAPEVVRAMGGLGSEACGALVPLMRDPAAAVRAAAASALGRCAGPDMAVDLVAALERERELEVRQALLHAIGRSGADDALDVLAARLDDDSSAARLAALEGLALTGRAEAVPLIERALGRSRHETLAALHALGDLGAPAAATIEPFLDSEDLDVRRAAARAAARVPDNPAPARVRALAGDADPWVRICAARMLARRSGGDDRLRALAETDPDRGVRDAARLGLRGDG